MPEADKNMKTALKRMGYRQMKKGLWGKPVAYHLFVVDLETSMFKNYFVGQNDKIFVYDSSPVNDELSIKSAEYKTRANVGSRSDFGFMSAEEMFADLL